MFLVDENVESRAVKDLLRQIYLLQHINDHTKFLLDDNELEGQEYEDNMEKFLANFNLTLEKYVLFILS